MPTIEEKGRELFSLKHRKGIIEADLTTINKQIQACEFALGEMFIEQDVEKITLTGLGTVYKSTKFSASVLADDRPALYEWLRANGHGDVVVDYVHPKSLTAWAKAQVASGGETPEFMTTYLQPIGATRKA
jgi:hypothetical protein